MGLLIGILSLIFGIIDGLLFLRFVFRFLGFPGVSIIGWVYDITAPLIAPFAGIIGDIVLGRFVIEVSTLIALVVYGVIYYVLSMVVRPRYVP